ncbi:MAG: DUF1638 domain-containing protein [Verrucomicrobia bacterium]|nr:DUF1638 domain-containing protein [Verrucomicrobiota bacterium]
MTSEPINRREPLRLKLISCEVFLREMCVAIARSPNKVDIEFLPKGLHDIGCAGMLQRMQAVLDAVDESQHDAVVFGYGLCNNGLSGLTARGIPIVIPRAHDCITLFLGSKERYLEYFTDHPGVYFKTSGWVERGEVNGELKQLSISRKTGMDSNFEELVAKYGEDNAKFLWEELCNTSKNYGQFTFIEMGIEPNSSFEQKTREDAAARGWKFEKVRGDMSMIQRLLDGQWDNKEFLVVPPGHKVVARYDEGIITAEKVT